MSNEIMDSLIKRINELAAKNKAEGLSAEEIEERDRLRKEYLRIFREGFKQRLENMYYTDENGNEVNVKDRKKNK